MTSENFFFRAVGVSVFVVVFLFVFRPFSLTLETTEQVTIYLGLGAVMLTILTLNHYFVFPLITGWKSGAGHTRLVPNVVRFWFLLSMMLGVYFYLAAFLEKPPEQFMNWSLFVKIGLVGSIPFALMALISQQSTLKRQLYEVTESHGASDASIVLQSANGKDQLRLDPNDVLFVRAEDNYVAIAHRSHDRVEEALLRATLSTFENLLADKGFVRCHRSYLINISAIRRLRRRAGTSVAELRAENLSIPVSRSCVPVLRRALKQSVL